MNKYSIFILSLCFAVFSGCADQSDPYKQFVVKEGIRYPQAAEGLTSTAGYYRAQITWDKPTDPSVKEAKVFWNNRNDSLAVDFSDFSGDIEIIIDDLPEDSQSFVVYTYDSFGNRSIPRETTTTIFGDRYMKSLIARSISSYGINPDGKAQIDWNSATPNLDHTELQYKSSGGTWKTVTVAANAATTIIDDINTSKPECFKYRSVYSLSTCIDLLYKDWQESETPIQ